MRVIKAVFPILFMLILALPGTAQTLTEAKTWRYTLVEGAAIMNDCPVCDRLSFWQPLRGSFDLKGTATPNLFAVTNINFVSDLTASPTYRVTGDGTLNFETGEPVLTLDVTITGPAATETVHMTNATPENPRIFPMLGVQADESPATISRVYRLRIQAAPIREMWFSTAANFTRGDGLAVSNGDLIANTGRVVKTNAQLTERLAIPPGDIGLDAVDIGPRGEIFFSSTVTVESIVNGTINHGDLVTAAGRVYLQNAQLLSAFGVDDPEAGLDAVHIINEDEIYFSISKEVTRTSGGKLRRGDILSSEGRIVRSEANLMLRFMNPLVDSVGVDALYVWPNGEVWFSPEVGFTGNGGIAVGAGDIVSDQGYVALRNLDLMGPFAPLEKISDFGLDAMTIISDADASLANLQIGDLAVSDSGVDLHWESAGRVFQVERATAVEGPYTPVTDLIVERQFHDAFTAAAAFYRVRQW